MKIQYKHTKYAAYLGYITQAIINNLPPLLFVTFQNKFNISLDKIGFLISLNFGIQIIVDLIAAKYVDKIGYRKAIVAAHIFCTAGLICLGLLPNFLGNPYLGLMISIVLSAMGGGIIEVLISPIVEALPGDEKESAMSMLHSFYCWGHVGVVILSTLFFVGVGINNWSILPILWAVVPLTNAIFFSKVPIKTLTEKEKSVPLRKLCVAPIFWLLFILMICSGASEQGMSQWASLFAEQGLNVSKTMGDLLGPCAFAILMGLSRVIYGIWGSRMNLKVTIIGSSILCVASYLTAVFAPLPILALVGCAICGFSVGIMWPGVFSLAVKTYPQGGTGMFAMLALAGDIGCSAGPFLVGMVSNRTGDLQKGLLLAIIFPIILFLGVCVLRKKAD